MAHVDQLAAVRRARGVRRVLAPIEARLVVVRNPDQHVVRASLDRHVPDPWVRL